MLAALASAFHHKALAAVEAELDTPPGKLMQPENRSASAFEKRMHWSLTKAFGEERLLGQSDQLGSSSVNFASSRTAG